MGTLLLSDPLPYEVKPGHQLDIGEGAARETVVILAISGDRRRVVVRGV